MIDRTLINILDEMVKEKKKKEFYKTRPKIKGKNRKKGDKERKYPTDYTKRRQ